MLYEDYLRSVGIHDTQIIRMNFESFEFDEIKTYKQLYGYIQNRIIDQIQKDYILLDEVQQVENWEKAINALLVDFYVDICITGSNAYLLSSELSTLLSGRYVEIKMFPLSFKEYLDYLTSSGRKTTSDTIDSYLRMLEASYIIYRANRFDLKGKLFLKILE